MFATTYEALDSIPTLRKPGVVIMFVILALGRWTQEDQRFVVILCYMVISSPAWAIRDPASEEKIEAKPQH